MTVGDKPVELSIISDIEDDIERQEQILHVYQTFQSGILFHQHQQSNSNRKLFIKNRTSNLNDLELQEMAEEDWVTYRNKIPKFDEHLENWTQKLAEMEAESPVNDWLKIQIESYKVIQLF